MSVYNNFECQDDLFILRSTFSLHILVLSHLQNDETPLEWPALPLYLGLHVGPSH